MTDAPRFPSSMRVFRSGVEFSTWPAIKFAQAQSHTRTLSSAINMWAATEPLTLDFRISEDRMHVDHVLNVHQPPPVVEWSVRFGDILHNLRSALDSLAWELCHLDGATPDKPRAIYFPAAESEEAWMRARKALASMPEDALTYINFLQPYMFEHPDSTYLGLLMKLSNMDKHQALVTCKVEPRRIFSRDSQLELDDGESTGGIPFTISALSHVDLVHGETIARLSAQRPIKSISGVNHVQVDAEIVFDKTSWPVLQLADLLTTHVLQVFDVLRGEYTEPLVGRNAMTTIGERVDGFD